jgi:hypothetical protein
MRTQATNTPDPIADAVAAIAVGRLEVSDAVLWQAVGLLVERRPPSAAELTIELRQLSARRRGLLARLWSRASGAQ